MKKGEGPNGFPVPRETLSRWLTDDQLDQAWDNRPRYRSNQASRVDGAWFDTKAVDKALKVFSSLRHTKGKWSGLPLKPDPWQIVWIIAPTFGWKHAVNHPDPELAGTRIIRADWIEVGRKNGKSSIASGMGLLLLTADGEGGAEVYSAATTREQAGIVHEDAKKMAMASPGLRGRVKTLKNLIRYPKTGSFYRTLSKVSDAAHGLNVHGAIVDEVHVHKNRDLIDAIETGTGARRQPLMVYLTTANDGDETTIYAEKHQYAIQVSEGTIKDPTFLPAIWCADSSDDPFTEETWRKANPGLGISPSLAYMREKAEKAQTTPSFYPTFVRLHLNIPTRMESKWFTPMRWDSCGGIIEEHKLKGRDAYGGIDLSNVSDFTAWVLLFPPTEDDPEWKVLPRLWLPREIMEERGPMMNTLLSWEKEGHLIVTEGNMSHYDAIEEQIGKDAEDFNIIEVAYDSWNAPQVVSHLQEAGMTVWPLHQSIKALNAPSKQLETWIGTKSINHGGHPVLRWMALNASVLMDGNGNIKPDKKKSIDKIDGISALVNAVAAATREREEESSGDIPFAWGL